MNKCIDCSKEISKYAVRCVICRNIYIAQNFVKGIPKSIKTKNILRKLALLRTPTRCGVKLSEIIKNKISKGLLNYYKDHIHHIDYNKFNCESSNLITLCLKCHLSTNGNRDYWYAYFRYITRTVC